MMRQSARQAQNLNAFASALAAAFATAVIAVYPLYIDRFSNLGLTKFAGVYTLLVLGCLLIGAFSAIGAAAVPGRYARARQDATLWSVGAFAVVSTLATCCSLSPGASLWGLGSYYGGLMLVALTTAGYFCVRSYFCSRDFGYLSAFVGVTVMIVTALYVLNILNIDLIGAYADTAVVERAQFFSTLGQKDFNAGYLSVALPMVFYYFLASDGRRPTALRAVPAVAGALALTVVDSDGLFLGVGVALAILVCHRDFTTRQLRRIAFLGATFFGWDWMMWMLRSNVYTQGGTPLLAKFGEPTRAVPGAALCTAVWLILWAARRGKTEVELYKAGRVLAGITVAGITVVLLLANFWQGFPSLGSLDNFFVFSDDWGTYRGTAWRSAWGAWLQGGVWRQLIGFGPGMMHQAVALWAGNEITARMKTFYAAHNEYLEQLLTTGLLGLAAWLGFVISHLRRGFRDWRCPGVAPVVLALCSYLAQAVVSIRVSMIFPEVMLLFGLLAAFTSPEIPPAAQPAPEKRARHHAGGSSKKGSAAASGRFDALRRPASLAVTAVLAMAISAPLSHLLLWFLFA